MRRRYRMENKILKILSLRWSKNFCSTLYISETETETSFSQFDAVEIRKFLAKMAMETLSYLIEYNTGLHTSSWIHFFKPTDSMDISFYVFKNAFFWDFRDYC